MIIFSIIIPHYNSTQLLSKCIESIPERDDTEIIVVDDCSDPNIVNFQIFPGLNRKNFRLVRYDVNGGGGKARNEGLKVARGRWLLFADCDDYFTNNINKLLDSFKDVYNIDIVYLNSQLVHEDPTHIESLPYSRYISNYNNKKIYAEKVLRYGMYTPWSRMVNIDLVNRHNLKFEEVRTGNDAMFCLNCSKYAKSICTFNEVVYNYYRPIQGSFCSQNRFKLDNIIARVELGLRMNQLFDSVDYIFKESFLLGIVLAKDSTYRKALFKIMKIKKINVLKDLYNLVIFCLGKAIKII